ncbi:hypothetical protein B0H14DRAFT_3704351, partial [Mycena olivaceomarginata]
MHDETPGSALTVHIRHLLLNYVVQHITTDYIQLTEQAVADLWAHYFVEIPTTDPNALILPTDPFDNLMRIHSLGLLEPFQEKFQSTPGAIQHIKKHIKPQAGKLKSDRVAVDESSFESYVPVCRPFSPILTTRAIRETPRPKVALPKFLDSFPPSHQEFLTSQRVGPIGVEPILEASVKQDDVLNTNWRLCSEEHDAVRSLLRSALNGPPKGYKNRHLDFSSRPDSPPIPSRIPEPQFIPIFPRRRRPGSGVREGDRPPSGLDGIASLPAIILPPVKIEELEPELHQQNMVIVNGWQAYRSSPSPTPSPSSSQEDQIDELFMESPNTTPPPVRPTKMEVVQIPRVRRIGGAKKKPLPIGHGKDLGTFLLPHVRKSTMENPPSRFLPDVSDSMVGQADSACESTLDNPREDLDGDIADLYSHQKQDRRDLIMKAKLDDKRQLLMEVPVLPPPNEHPPNALFLPSSLGEFVAPLKAKGQTHVEHPMHKFLKKAKGIPSLNVELSWVPITAKTRIPTGSEIIKVASLLDNDAPSSDLSTQIAALLAQVPATLSTSELPIYADTWSRRYRSNIYPEVQDSDPEISRCEIILSRKERRRAAGLPDEVQDEDMEEETYDNAIYPDVVDPEDAPIDDRAVKRPRLSWNNYSEDSGVAFDQPPPDLDHGSPTFYDDAESYPYPYGGGKENLDPPPPNLDASYDPESYPYAYDGDKENAIPYDDPWFPTQSYYDNGAPGFSAADEQFDLHTQATAYPPAEFRTSQDDDLEMEMASAVEPKEFVALSFDESQPTQQPPLPPASNDTYGCMFEPNATNPLSPAPEIASRSLGIAEFAKLRAKRITVPVPEPLPAPSNIPPDASDPSHTVPESIYDRHTLRLPAPASWPAPASQHRYLASMALVQKQGLVRTLRARACAVALVERDALGGADLVLDPHTAVLFANLLVLPAEGAGLARRVAEESWRYRRLLVVLEAYPAAYGDAYARRGEASELFAYSPPVVRALGKLRRDVGIAEGCGAKSAGCAVGWAFADTVEEAGRYVRVFGDQAEAGDAEEGGVVWGDRAWLDDDVPEGEQDLAAVDGMNHFAAYVILCQIDLGEFLELSPEERVERFGAFVGVERMVGF